LNTAVARIDRSIKLLNKLVVEEDLEV
jgi:hypothetical protein